MKLKPLGDRVILKYQEAEEKTQSGIILPDSAKEKPQEAVVAAAGDGTTTAAVPTRVLVRKGLKNIAAGVNSTILQKGMKKQKRRLFAPLRI